MSADAQLKRRGVTSVGRDSERVDSSRDVDLLVAGCRSTLRLSEPLGDEYRYAHLSLCVLDAIYSIGVKYQSTQAVVARYAAWAGLTQNRPGDVLPSIEAQQPLGALVDHVREVGPDSFAADVVCNRQRTSTRGGILKSDAVLRYAEVLGDHEVRYLQDVAPRAGDQDLGRALRAVKGQASGISTSYFFMLAGDEMLVKPDRMLERFVSRAIGREVDVGSIQPLVTAACHRLQGEHPGLTPRGLDHAMWNYERERVL